MAGLFVAAVLSVMGCSDARSTSDALTPLADGSPVSWPPSLDAPYLDAATAGPWADATAMASEDVVDPATRDAREMDGQGISADLAAGAGEGMADAAPAARTDGSLTPVAPDSGAFPSADGSAGTDTVGGAICTDVEQAHPTELVHEIYYDKRLVRAGGVLNPGLYSLAQVERVVPAGDGRVGQRTGRQLKESVRVGRVGATSELRLEVIQEAGATQGQSVARYLMVRMEGMFPLILWRLQRLCGQGQLTDFEDAILNVDWEPGSLRGVSGVTSTGDNWRRLYNCLGADC